VTATVTGLGLCFILDLTASWVGCGIKSYQLPLDENQSVLYREKIRKPYLIRLFEVRLRRIRSSRPRSNVRERPKKWTKIPCRKNKSI
jgi:hypothetical protein